MLGHGGVGNYDGSTPPQAFFSLQLQPMENPAVHMSRLSIIVDAEHCPGQLNQRVALYPRHYMKIVQKLFTRSSSAAKINSYVCMRH